MPIYEYFCSKCDKSMDIMQDIDEPVLTECPTCHSREFTKKVSVSSFKLTGTGWYETDFKGSKSNSGSSSGNGK